MWNRGIAQNARRLCRRSKRRKKSLQGVRAFHTFLQGGSQQVHVYPSTIFEDQSSIYSQKLFTIEHKTIVFILSHFKSTLFLPLRQASMNTSILSSFLANSINDHKTKGSTKYYVVDKPYLVPRIPHPSDACYPSQVQIYYSTYLHMLRDNSPSHTVQ